MLVSEQAPLPVVTHIGTQGLAGYLIPTFMALCGVLLWLNPTDRIIYSLLALFLALGSWITSNLGGFFVGMLTGVLGGSLAFAWTTDSEYRSPGWIRATSRVTLPSPPLILLFRLTRRAPPRVEGRGLATGSARLALPWVPEENVGYLADDEAQVLGQELVSDQTVGDGPTAGEGLTQAAHQPHQRDRLRRRADSGGDRVQRADGIVPGGLSESTSDGNIAARDE
jgi:hypothetical protein